ncbi:ALA-interacting subunit 3 [Vitis vinifera]|uniref:ALA-interacting subunit 3 n=1 Tax=Vitis vinifera TaxID=29760 RepID=A0A438BWP0_VITVI|nr:ALA-interacting subunit 3 [Vitis vinifera]
MCHLYVKSRSDKQLRSRASENDTSSCDPEDVTSNKSAIVPCGLIAWSLFNDTYGFSVNNTLLGSGGLIGGAKLNSSIPSCLTLYLFFVMHVTVESTSGSYCLDANCSTANFQKTIWEDRGSQWLEVIHYPIDMEVQIFITPAEYLPLGDPTFLSWNRNPAGHFNFN